MSARIPVGVLGATGMVGQNYIRLLADHPWFEVVYVAASPRSTGMTYAEAVKGRWHMLSPLPDTVAGLTVRDAGNVGQASNACSLVFSAVEMDKQAVAALELAYAGAGCAVVSNNSAHRFTPDVPMVIPEVNHSHLDIIPIQRKNRGWERGLLAVKSNCSIQSYMTPVHALIAAGFPVSRMFVSTMQALSGAGHPGLSALDVLDNVIPYIKGEEEKSEKEPRKVLGFIEGDRIVGDDSLRISAHCNRVPVIHGHMACVSVEFGGNKPSVEDAIAVWQGFRSVPQELKLPSAPAQPIVYRAEHDRPQPHKDREAGNAMAVTVGRARPCNLLDLRFVGLHHNTVRGAAGGAILTAELLKARGFLG